ncbi:cupredoxin domain-containing protein [Phenylobacterium sp.]|uniref:cupredoxin domain-containing protein n=1 Tax=Phenylobacterium sp. TaxID=1871053 RepID=UPI002639A383|nr:cupredoxin domain-containing protein [Phenylobacterium sp.]
MGAVSRRMAAAAGLALLSLAACNRAPPPAPKTYQVTIANMAYGPTPSGLRTGDVIEWVNNDIFQHTATAKDGSFDVDLPPQAHARTVLKAPGVVAFYCRYHPGMTGKLVVAG